MWTAEEQARWPEETRVLVDLCLERGAVEVYAPEDCDAALHVRRHEVKPYQLCHTYADRLWYSAPDIHEDYDSLRDVDVFDFRQAWVPVARMPVSRLEETLTINGQVFMLQQLAQINFMSDREVAQQLAAAINAPTRIGARMIIEATADGDNWFQISPEPPAPMRVIYRDPSPTSMTRFGPRRRFQEKPSRVPAAVEKNRRRLDGRRS